MCDFENFSETEVNMKTKSRIIKAIAAFVFGSVLFIGIKKRKKK